MSGEASVDLGALTVVEVAAGADDRVDRGAGQLAGGVQGADVVEAVVQVPRGAHPRPGRGRGDAARESELPRHRSLQLVGVGVAGGDPGGDVLAGQAPRQGTLGGGEGVLQRLQQRDLLDQRPVRGLRVMVIGLGGLGGVLDHHLHQPQIQVREPHRHRTRRRNHHIQIHVDIAVEVRLGFVEDRAHATIVLEHVFDREQLSEILRSVSGTLAQMLGEPDRSRGSLVRPAMGRDVDEIARVWTQGWREAHLGHVPEELVVARTPESFRTRTRENLDRTVVADVDGHLAGFVVWCDDEIEQLYLAADRRGRGVARSLLRAGEARIAELGHDEAWLAVVAGNVRARSFYARCGWIDSGPFSHHAPDGITVPAHRYTRVLTR